MTNAADTPGPWRVFDVFTHIEIVTDRPTGNETESLVQFKGQRNAHANARLMAAAPEFLDALLDAKRYLEEARNEVDHGDNEVEDVSSYVTCSARLGNEGIDRRPMKRPPASATPARVFALA
jgi:hypothetical protein